MHRALTVCVMCVRFRGGPSMPARVADSSPPHAGGDRWGRAGTCDRAGLSRKRSNRTEVPVARHGALARATAILRDQIRDAAVMGIAKGREVAKQPVQRRQTRWPLDCGSPRPFDSARSSNRRIGAKARPPAGNERAVRRLPAGAGLMALVVRRTGGQRLLSRMPWTCRIVGNRTRPGLA
jgi:hypothetical protein